MYPVKGGWRDEKKKIGNKRIKMAIICTTSRAATMEKGLSQFYKVLSTKISFVFLVFYEHYDEAHVLLLHGC